MAGERPEIDRGTRRSGSKQTLFLGACLFAGIAVGGWLFSNGNRSRSPVGPTLASAPKLDLAAVRPRVAAFCGDCHAVPLPERFPQAAWHEEVQKGYKFYFESERTDLSPPPMQEVTEFFRSQAPPELAVAPSSALDASPGPLRFERLAIAPLANEDRGTMPAISHLKWLPAEPGPFGTCLACDMQSGDIRAIRKAGDKIGFAHLGRTAHPAHVEPCDLDGDGRLDLIVADLGSFLPEDHQRGSVVWLRRGEAGETFEPLVIAEGLGRVADAQPGDFDGDGDLDLVVAEFGWHRTGRILLLENRGPSAAPSAGNPAKARDPLSGGDAPSQKAVGAALVDRPELPQFQLRVLDPRHGTIHVPPADLNGDGRLDFVALISQEHEKIEAFVNQADGTFRRETIFAADDPAYGSSGIQLVDLDRDGDLDVLYTNGDTFDSFYLKPYHSIQWLENRGSFPYVHHHLTDFPGVHRALAVDLDGDHDFDIVAAALLPARLFSRHEEARFDSVIWLEQTQPGEFRRHGLEKSACHHAALEVGDFDGDNRPDIAVGNFYDSPTTAAPCGTIWRNAGAR